MIDFALPAKAKHGKGPRTKKQRRKLAGLDAQRIQAEKTARRQQGDIRKALNGINERPFR